MKTKEFLDYMKDSGKIGLERYNLAIAKEKAIKEAKAKVKNSNLTKAELKSIVDVLGGGK